MYTIMLLNPKTDVLRLSNALRARIAQDGRFKVNYQEVGQAKTTKEDRQTLGQVFFMPAILMKGIRLTQKKSYCKQHALECQVDPFTGKLPHKPMSTFLEHQDWITFHQVVNGLLNQRHTNANIWTNPLEKLDKGNRMWIRRGTQARIKWDVDGQVNRFGRIEETWNHGDSSQFIHPSK